MKNSTDEELIEITIYAVGAVILGLAVVAFMSWWPR
jgi:hypothetical protein